MNTQPAEQIRLTLTQEGRDISSIFAEISPLEITTDLWIKAGMIALSLRREGGAKAPPP
jgi:hypothetical protein